MNQELVVIKASEEDPTAILSIKIQRHLVPGTEPHTFLVHLQTVNGMRRGGKAWPTKTRSGDTIPPLKLESYRQDKDGSGGHILKFLCPKALVEHIKDVQGGVVNSTQGAVAVYWKGQKLTPGHPVTYLGRGTVLAAPESLGGGGRGIVLLTDGQDLEAPLEELHLAPERAR